MLFFLALRSLSSSNSVERTAVSSLPSLVTGPASAELPVIALYRCMLILLRNLNLVWAYIIHCFFLYASSEKNTKLVNGLIVVYAGIKLI